MEYRSARDVWEEALGRLRPQMSAAAYATWLDSTDGVSLDDDEIVISVQTEYAQHWLQGSLLPMMERAVSEVRQRHVRVILEVVSDGLQTPAIEPEPVGTGADAQIDNTASQRPSRGGTYMIGARPDPQLTFDQFVVGDNTKLAFAAATKVASDRIRDYNPLVLYGPPGLGKTHLLHAIAHEAQGHSRTTLLATSEQFVHDYVTSVQNKTTARFRDLYRFPGHPRHRRCAVHMRQGEERGSPAAHLWGAPACRPAGRPLGGQGSGRATIHGPALGRKTPCWPTHRHSGHRTAAHDSTSSPSKHRDMTLRHRTTCWHTSRHAHSPA